MLRNHCDTIFFRDTRDECSLRMRYVTIDLGSERAATLCCETAKSYFAIKIRNDGIPIVKLVTRERTFEFSFFFSQRKHL